MTNKNKTPYIVCDIDGTVSDSAHRVHYLEGEKKNYAEFFSNAVNDLPHLHVIQMLKINQKELREIGSTKSDGAVSKKEQLFLEEFKPAKVLFLTSRPTEYYLDTAEWLHKYIPKDVEWSLIMRPIRDARPDVEFKKEVIQSVFGNSDAYVALAIEDRPRCVKMYRSMGIRTIDVGDGIPF